jgi:hypothetical protein
VSSTTGPSEPSEAQAEPSRAPAAHGLGPRPGGQSRPRIPSPATITCIIVFGFALAMGVLRLAIPGVLSGLTAYDDGVYFGGSLQLFSGSIPYRDFVFVHPPGILLLLGPFALVGKALGTSMGFELARVATTVVVAINALLAALLVKKLGVACMAVAGIMTAAYPIAVINGSSVTLEPFLILFILMGSLFLFTSSEPTEGALLWAGVMFGVAGTVKIWAFFPFIAAAALVVFWHHRNSRPFFFGTVLGFGVPSAFFFLCSPSNFLHDVVIAQFLRHAATSQLAPFTTRLYELSGLVGVDRLVKTTPMAGVWFFGLLGVGTATLFWLDRSRTSRLDAYVLAVTTSCLLCLLVAPEYQLYYGYFTAPFVALLLAVDVHKLRRIARARSGRRSHHWRMPTGAKSGIVVLASLFLVVLALREFQYSSFFLDHRVRGTNGTIIEPHDAVTTAIPGGSCVVSDSPAILILGDRFLSTRANCPAIVDPYGMWLVDNGGNVPPQQPPFNDAFVASWKATFERADYVVLTSPRSDYIPWDYPLATWFNAHYTLVSRGPLVAIFYHRGFGLQRVGPR